MGSDEQKAKPAAPPAAPVAPVAPVAPAPTPPAAPAPAGTAPTPAAPAPTQAAPPPPARTVQASANAGGVQGNLPEQVEDAPGRADAGRPNGPGVEKGSVRPREGKLPEAPGPASDANQFQLPAAVYSPQLLESVVFDIQTYLDWYHQNQIRLKVGAKPKGEPNHSDETVVTIEAWLQGKPPTLESLQALVDHLRKLDLPEIHVMLAALPNRAQRQQLVDWFRNNATPKVLLSFVADRNLGGGIVVRTPNRVFDFTWKQELVAGRDKLAGILKRV